MKRIFLCLWVLVILGSASVNAAESEPIEPQSVRFGHERAIQVVALSESTPITVGVYDLNYLRRVGGIAFGGVAVPDSPYQGLHIELDYDADAEDGSRFRVRVGSEWVLAPLYDWQLRPIVEFVDEGTHAAFSLFGSTVSGTGLVKSFEDSRPQLTEYNARFALAYHPAFQDTLLGLRLFQMDTAFVDLEGVFADLPKDKEGTRILGNGEVERSFRPETRAANDWALEMLFLAVALSRFESYVIVDVPVTIHFGISEGQLVVSGEPYFWFWRENELGEAEHLSAISELVFESTTVEGMPVFEYANPLVYGAVRTVMRYAAFLRYAQSQMCTQDWDDFVATVSLVDVYPDLRTPNVMYDLQQGCQEMPEDEFLVMLEWSGPYDLDLEIWSEDLQYIGDAWWFGGSSDITHGSQGAEWLAFQDEFASGRYVISAYFAGPPTDDAVEAILTVVWPDGRRQSIQQTLRYASPYDQWFALEVDADTHEVRVIDALGK